MILYVNFYLQAHRKIYIPYFSKILIFLGYDIREFGLSTWNQRAKILQTTAFTTVLRCGRTNITTHHFLG